MSSSLTSEIVNNALNYLVQSTNNKLEWIPCSQITDIEPTQIDAIYYAVHNGWESISIMLLRLGDNEECTQTLVSEFARTYSLPTHQYSSYENNFRRYSKWLKERNECIWGFTKLDNSYYMVAHK